MFDAFFDFSMRLLKAFGFLLALAAAIAGGYTFGMTRQQQRDAAATRNTAIQYECAQYNPQTGKFEWLERESAMAEVARLAGAVPARALKQMPVR